MVLISTEQGLIAWVFGHEENSRAVKCQLLPLVVAEHPISSGGWI